MRRALPNVLLTILALNTFWFVVHSIYMASAPLRLPDLAEAPRVFTAGTGAIAPIAIALHMVTGAILTIGAPIQAMPFFRKRWPGLHFIAGQVLAGLAVATGLSGLLYIAVWGTVGGWWMSLWFGVYGGLMIWAGLATRHFGRARDRRNHRAWATRLVILAVGSWIYRMHYAIWYGLTGGAGTAPDFSGLFDRIQVFAFFVPYLLIAELVMRRHHLLRVFRA